MFARRHTVQSNAPMLRYNTSLSLSCARYCIRCDVRCWHWSHRLARQLHYLHAVCNTHYIQVPRALFLFQFVPVPGVYTVYDVHANFYLQSPVTWRCRASSVCAAKWRPQNFYIFTRTPPPQALNPWPETWKRGVRFTPSLSMSKPSQMKAGH